MKFSKFVKMERRLINLESKVDMCLEHLETMIEAWKRTALLKRKTKRQARKMATVDIRDFASGWCVRCERADQLCNSDKCMECTLDDRQDVIDSSPIELTKRDIDELAKYY